MSGHVVYLLRHGPPVRPGLLLGHTDDLPLDVECPILAERVSGLPAARIVTSDMSRTRLQAAHLARQMGVPLIRDPCWRELNFGEWEGLAPETIAESALSRFWDDPDGNPPPGGESWSELRARVSSALTRIDNQTLVVTHAGAMRAALSVLTGLDHRGVWAIDLPYRALLTLRIWSTQPASGQVIGLATGNGA